MACMDHNCSACKRDWMDNRTWYQCPHCKAVGTVSNWFDEAPDYDYPEREEHNDD